MVVNFKDVDFCKLENRFKFEVVLFYGCGKELKIVVIVDGVVVEVVKKFGFDVISGEELEELVKSLC